MPNGEVQGGKKIDAQVPVLFENVTYMHMTGFKYVKHINKAIQLEHRKVEGKKKLESTSLRIINF